jgi:hypothetical protein
MSPDGEAPVRKPSVSSSKKTEKVDPQSDSDDEDHKSAVASSKKPAKKVEDDDSDSDDSDDDDSDSDDDPLEPYEVVLEFIKGRVSSLAKDGKVKMDAVSTLFKDEKFMLRIKKTLTPKKHKRLVDANKPKQAPSAYLMFCNENRKVVQEKTKLKSKELVSKIGEIWNAMPAEEKAVWEKKAKPAQEEYKLQMVEYNKSKPSKEELADRPENKPKIKKTLAYNCFVAEKAKDARDKGKSYGSGGAMSAVMGPKWKRLLAKVEAGDKQAIAEHKIYVDMAEEKDQKLASGMASVPSRSVSVPSTKSSKTTPKSSKSDEESASDLTVRINARIADIIKNAGDDTSDKDITKALQKHYGDRLDAIGGVDALKKIVKTAIKEASKEASDSE